MRPYSLRGISATLALMHRRTVLLLLWLLSDVLLFIAAYALAYVLRVGWIFSSDFPLVPFLRTVALVAPLWVIILAQLGVFRLMRMQRAPRNIAHILFACIVGSALFTLAYYFLHGRFFSRLLLVYALLLSTLLAVGWHILYERLLRALLRRGTPAYPTLIVGATREAAQLIRILNEQRHPLVPVGILDGRGTKEKELAGVPVLGKLNKLEESLEALGITHLMQCSDLEQSINLLSACRKRGIIYLLLPSVLGIVERDERIESVEGRPMTVVRPKEAVWKWFFS